MMSPMKKFDLKKIEKVEIRNIWENEGTEFTPWLAKEENIELLGSAIGIDLVVEAQRKTLDHLEQTYCAKMKLTDIGY